MSQQIAVRIPDDLAGRLDSLVDEGHYATLADAVRAGIRELIERREEREIDERIIEGYRRTPPTAADEAWAERSGRELIAEEPW